MFWNSENNGFISPFSAYKYEASNLRLNIDSIGYFNNSKNGGVFSFFKINDQLKSDTLAKVNYIFETEQLIIQNTLFNTSLKIRYKAIQINSSEKLNELLMK